MTSGFRVGWIDEYDEFFVCCRLVYFFRYFGEATVKEVELEGMVGEDDVAFLCDADVGRVVIGGEYGAFVAEAREEVARAGGAVPDKVVLGPCFAECAGKVFVGFFDPAFRGEEGSLAFADVLFNEQVAAREYEILEFVARRAFVCVPEAGVSGGVVLEMDFAEKVVVWFFRNFVVVGLEEDFQVGAEGLIVFRHDVGEVEVSWPEVGREFLWQGYGGPYLSEPSVEDMDEVGGVDGDVADGQGAAVEPVAHGFKVGCFEEFDFAGDQGVYGLDGFGGGRTGSFVPVDVVECEDGEHVGEADEGDIRGVVGTEEHGWEGAAVKERFGGEYELGEHAGLVGVGALGFDPCDFEESVGEFDVDASCVVAFFELGSDGVCERDTACHFVCVDGRAERVMIFGYHPHF